MKGVGKDPKVRVSTVTASCVLGLDWGLVVVEGSRERSERSVKLLRLQCLD